MLNLEEQIFYRVVPQLNALLSSTFFITIKTKSLIPSCLLNTVTSKITNVEVAVICCWEFRCDCKQRVVQMLQAECGSVVKFTKESLGKLIVLLSFLQDNANSFKAQLDQQRSVVENLISNTRVCIFLWFLHRASCENSLCIVIGLACH
jgi:hypothetical protein